MWSFTPNLVHASSGSSSNSHILIYGIFSYHILLPSFNLSSSTYIASNSSDLVPSTFYNYTNNGTPFYKERRHCENIFRPKYFKMHFKCVRAILSPPLLDAPTRLHKLWNVRDQKWEFSTFTGIHKSSYHGISTLIRTWFKESLGPVSGEKFNKRNGVDVYKIHV